MAVWSPSGSGQTHIDAVLTQISIGWPNNGMVGEQLFPVVNVKKQADKYYIFGREAWLPETSDYRAPGTEANEIPGYTVSLDTYYCQEHALQMAIPDEEREQVDSAFTPDRDATELLTSKILLSREVKMQTLVTTAANYATGLSVTLSAGTTCWDAYATSDPIGVWRTSVRAVNAKVFMDPNVAVIPYQVMSVLEDHPDIIERIKYSERAILTPELIAAVFGMEKVIVPGLGIGTGGVGALGNAIVPGYLWGKDVVMAWVPQRPGLRTPAFAYEFTWNYGGQAQIVDRWREDKRKSDLIRTSRRYDLKMVGNEINPASGDFGKSVTGYLIKQAIS
jgi:hypothetical protein